MPNRRERRKQEKNKKKDRFIGLQFSLDGIPKEELKSLRIGTKVTQNGIEAIIRTDNHEIPTNSVKGYRRESKPGFNLKKTNVVTHTSKMEISSNLQKFDCLIAIDTNSNRKQSPNVHIGAAAQIFSVIDDNKLETEAEIIKTFTLIGDYDKPENHNWKELITYIISHKNHNSKTKIGLIVDSDLGEIPEYNSREKPIIDNYFLPDNFELIYASADSSNDEITNQAIAFCDKIASEVLKGM